MKADPNYVNPSGKNAKKTAGFVFQASSTLTPSGCMEWNKKIFPNGYGCFPFKGKYLLAHRVAYEWKHGVALTKSDIICHTCDNPPCVNPDHLVCADHSYNARDMIAKGRDNYASGECAGNSKLTEDGVLEIRRLRYEENMQCKDIAKLFNVSAKQISIVSRGVQWKTKK